MSSIDYQLGYSIYSANNFVSKEYKKILKKLGITYPQYLVLCVLWENDNVMVSQIAKKLKLDTPTITPILKRLESSGFVARFRDKYDERKVLVTLTKKSFSIKEESINSEKKILKKICLDNTKLNKLVVTLNEIRNKLS